MGEVVSPRSTGNRCSHVSFVKKIASSGTLSQHSTDVGSLAGAEASPFIAERTPSGTAWDFCDDIRAAAAGAQQGAALALHAGVAEIPHPDKVEYGGEDSWFISDDGSAMGVADGVSEWGWRFGLNPRHFAQQLMQGACDAVKASPEGRGAGSVVARALEAGFANTTAFGAATALVMRLDAEGSALDVASIGDCGLRLLRRDPCTSRMSVVERTVEQAHAFNQPFQLACTPRSRDFPRLRAEGKGALVQAVKQSQSSKTNAPSDAENYRFKVHLGDLVILGSDGLFDNLDDAELCDVAERLLQEQSQVDGSGAKADPTYLALGIANAAAERSADAEAMTPFARRAQQNGHEVSGGVKDDITVLVAWVSESA